MPENSWLLIGPWRTRFTTPPEPGPYYLSPIHTSGGHMTRIVDWRALSGVTTTRHNDLHSQRVSHHRLDFHDLVVTVHEPNNPILAIDHTAVPLALACAVDNAWAVYLPIRMNGNDGLFARVATMAADDPAQPPLDTLITAMPEHGKKVGSHESWYFKHAPDTEYEHKITLDSTVDIYTLARDIRNHVGHGPLNVYRWEYRDDWQTWWYGNHLFEIPASAGNGAGYVSFIPTLNGGYILKRKIFARDGFKRIELKSRCDQPLPTIGHKLAHLRETMGLQATYLGRFDRIRFDITLEHIDTGNIHSIMIDRCEIAHQPEVLQQLEIEYLRSRGDARNCEAEIIAELDQLKTWTLQHLSQADITFSESHLSKYTFLRRLAGAA